MQGDQKHPTVHLLIDLQLGCLAGMEPEAAQDYLDNMAETIDSLREQGVPTLWVTIGDACEVHPAQKSWSKDQKAAPRSEAEINKMGFIVPEGHDVPETAKDKLEIFQKFLEEHGPKQDEAMFEKRFLDAFLDPNAMQGNDLMAEHLLTHRRDETIEDIHNAFQGQSLMEYLETKGTEQVLISGMMADVCVLETAIGARRNGLDCQVLCDVVASVEDTTYQKSPKNYQEQISTAVSQIVEQSKDLEKDPTKQTYVKNGMLSDGAKKDLTDNIQYTTTKDFCQSMNAAPKVDPLKQSGPRQGSRFQM